VTSVAVVAHAGKSLGGGLSELRLVLESAGVNDPVWHEVAKSRYVAKSVRRALAAGAELLFVWGGDGMVQQTIDAIGDDDAAIAILPAGTGNLLARNLGVPRDIQAAVEIGLHGARRKLDVGRINGERFAVMAGTGLDALMIRGADGPLKDHFGRAAYLWTGAKHLRVPPFHARIKIDGTVWFEGKTSCLLVGNVGKVLGGIEAFDGATPDDGILDLGVVTAKGAIQWTRMLVRTATGSASRSRFVRTTEAEKIRIKLGRKVPYEVDGGPRRPTNRIEVCVEPAAVTLCVPETMGV
jgi:diacylglycerol kinase family enzyme